MEPAAEQRADEWTTGFLLTQEWHDGAAGCTATFWGRGADGPFALRVGLRPVLFVPKDTHLPEGIVPIERRAPALRSFQREPVEALYFARQHDLLAARDRCRVAGVPVFEGDLDPAARHLMERFIHGACAFSGPWRDAGGYRRYDNPRMRPTDYRPTLSRLSFDIETGTARQLYAIASHYRDAAREERHVFVAGHGRRYKDSPVQFCADEAGALAAFLEHVRLLDPDILCGWNILGFDLPFLAEKANEAGFPLTLGRGSGVVRMLETGGRWSAYVSGRVIVDGIPALRAASYAFEDFRLETVARSLLGGGKMLDFAGQDKPGTIDRLFRDDKETLARYCLRDAELVSGILDKTALVDLFVSRSVVSGLLPERLGRSVAAFDHFFLPRLHRKGFVAPDRDGIEPIESLPGGLVFTPHSGLHDHVAVLDFRSLYPSLIRTFKICPYAWLMAATDPVRTPSGATFSATEHILPDYVEELMAARARAQAGEQAALAQAVKLLMNSFYGVLGAPASRFYNPVLPTAITAAGQWVLRAAREHLEADGYRVLYGDTDSLFVLLRAADAAAPHEAGARLAAETNDFLATRLQTEYGAASALELTFRHYCRRLYLPAARQSHAGHVDEAESDGHPEGAAKRYAGLVEHQDGHAELLVVGLESVRSDWTPLARRVQREMLWRVFRDEPYDLWLREQVATLRSGRLDGELVYRRHLHKPPSAYTHSHPPHVKAAMLLPPERQTGAISYVMTRRGPVPVELPHNDLDYEHYVDRQLRPVIDDLIHLAGRTFDSVLSGEEQMRLF